QAPVRYEIPPDVVREAIVNAIAHRDYTSAGAVQVSVFADRVEVWNPGTLTPPLTMESLRHPHGSVARNPHICDVLFLAGYIEKYGTGTLMMIRETLAHDLPEPDFMQRGGEFTITLWRDWLTPEVLAGYNLNERQMKAVLLVKTGEQLSNKDYQQKFEVSKPTASRDLEELVRIGIVTKIGTTGKGTYYILDCKGLIKGSKGS
ncbi:ATP-binding protein, partial [Acidaminobacter sp.]|uniref:ATP-binding protein n=1 Tax=Acidaminobacter sp. TaxID=1872102 RepID=UPI00255DDABC